MVIGPRLIRTRTPRCSTVDLDDPAVVRTAPRSGAAVALRRFARIVARRRVGIAFSAGGARGIAHVGALRCFERAGIEFDMVAGTSGPEVHMQLRCPVGRHWFVMTEEVL
jgi:hypothetical protein